MFNHSVFKAFIELTGIVSESVDESSFRSAIDSRISTLAIEEEDYLKVLKQVKSEIFELHYAYKQVQNEPNQIQRIINTFPSVLWRSNEHGVIEFVNDFGKQFFTKEEALTDLQQLEKHIDPLD